MEQSLASFGDIATQYASDVVNGLVPACKWHKLACQRHLDDLEKASAGEWPYIFNPELTDVTGKLYRPAERICKFAELMPHIKGDWAAQGQLIKLELWQIFALASTFGWINKHTLKRRFREADLFVPRKNAKSTLAAVIGHYMFAVDGEFGAEVYSGATSEDQAYEVFRPANLMARATHEFRRMFGITVNVSNMAITETNSKFEPVIGKPGDGASPSLAIVDEYHEHKTPELYDTMKTGMGARSQPLMLVITTAGSDISGPCYAHQVELQKILEGVIENDRRWGIIFTIDETDDWTSIDALIKANPNYGVSVDEDFLQAQQKDAIEDPRKQSIFKTKHLNIWVQAASPWLNMHKLQRAGNKLLSMEHFRGEPCVVGLDLATKTDIASVCYVFRRERDNKPHYYFFWRNYVPQSAADKEENTHYRGWIAKGYLTATPGNMIALGQIKDDIIASAEHYVIAEVTMDEWGGREMATSLQEDGFTVINIPMQVRHLSEPMKEIAAIVDDDRLHHDGNECVVWQLGNVEVAPDRNENIFPRKSKPQNKIDAAVAAIVAMSRAMVGVKKEKSFWES